MDGFPPLPPPPPPPFLCNLNNCSWAEGKKGRKGGEATTKEKEGLELIRLDNRERKGWRRVRNSSKWQYTAC